MLYVNKLQKFYSNYNKNYIKTTFAILFFNLYLFKTFN